MTVFISEKEQIGPTDVLCQGKHICVSAGDNFRLYNSAVKFPSLLWGE